MTGTSWWLYPYGKDDNRLAWGGSGLGGQRPIFFPDYDLLVVFTGWNILPNRPSLTPRIAIDRVLEAVVDRRSVTRPVSLAGLEPRELDHQDLHVARAFRPARRASLAASSGPM